MDQQENSAQSANAEATADPVDTEALKRLLAALGKTRDEVAKSVVGQTVAIDQMLIALICGGHVLLEGAPGVGKTLLVRTLGTAAGLKFSRIQFTPDLMPADITGGLTLVPDKSGHSRLEFQEGPIFTQILLTDEVNRATPKTQSALLEAMQEHTVTAGGQTLDLPEPFFVLATQNPIEMEGTYRLPEAQIDRFLFKTLIVYPSESELDGILDLTTGVSLPVPEQILSAEDILALQKLVRQVPIAAHVRSTVSRFALLTQADQSDNPTEVTKYLRFGLSPRGAQSLILAAKGHALLRGRYNVGFEDLQEMLGPVVRHRLQLNYEGEAEGVDIATILKKLLETEIRKAT